MLCECHWIWIVLYTVHFIAFCLGGGGFRTRCIVATCNMDKKLQYVSAVYSTTVC